ncbi:Protein of unknown function [Cotesia congregata]|uniref:Endonuclease/exonuclease/phosphatase domain-containing protein n=1 Tax=Cotesia congregata TaxID=51543 RepID=A0A8J2H6C7_COTCN|nr:Protein of unknown function [Cotesia congregata]
MQATVVLITFTSAYYKKTGTYDWKCQSCKFEVSIIDSDDENEDSGTNISPSAAKTMEELFKKYLAPFSEKISALESSIQSIRLDMNKLAEGGKSTSKHFVQLDKRITDVEKKLSTEGQSLSSDDIIAEIVERQKMKPSDSDVIYCVSESWLNSTISNGEVVEDTFKLFRKDRDSQTSKFARGGGVLIAVHRNITAELVPLNKHNIEQVFIKIKESNGEVIIIGCVYLPPQSTVEIFKDHLDTIHYINNIYPNAKIIIIGDYNIPNSYPPARTDPILEEDVYHPALSIHVSCTASMKLFKEPQYCFKKANYIALNDFFLNTNWLELYNIKTVDEKLLWFYKKIKLGISEHVPVYTNNRSEYPRWFSKELIRKIKLEKQVHKNYKKYRSYHTYKEFQNIRKECKSLSIICYNNYVTRMENLIHEDTTQFWNFVKSKRRKDSNIPSTMNWSENTANTGEEVSNLFASYFKSMYMGTHDSSVNQINKLSQRRQISDLIFAFKIINGHIDSPEIREKVGIICPTSNLRANQLIETIKTTKSYIYIIARGIGSLI